MPKRRELELSVAERATLEDMRDHASKPYLRERAAALLKIADGVSPAVIARSGLLRTRKPDTLYDWLNRWQAEGVEGLRIRPGRGRKAFFSPLERV